MRLKRKIANKKQLQRPKHVVKKLLKMPTEPLTLEDVAEAREHIRNYWSELYLHETKDRGTTIGLPFPYLVPSTGEHAFSFREQYYWDSFFMAIGLREEEDQAMIEGMLENLIYLFDRYDIIPNSSRMYMLSRSQPPMLTSYIFYVYDTFDKDKKWLREKIKVAKKEYERVWMSEKHPTWHQVHRGLSRYYDINVMHDMAEMESGWDMTTRFSRKCLDFLPIDLNCILYKVEVDFARAARILGDPAEQQQWLGRASKRQDVVNDLMWNKTKKFYFDYNYQKKKQGTVYSLAAYFALWSGLATKEQAAGLVKNLERFEGYGGLATTAKPLIDETIFGSLKTQWAYPNGWAPLQYIAVKGMKNYGYTEDAERVARRWLRTNLSRYISHGDFLEKYNVVNTKKPPVNGVYPNQSGFGWTNAIFERFSSEWLKKR